MDLGGVMSILQLPHLNFHLEFVLILETIPVAGEIIQITPNP